jgi:hypothetical protein
LRKELRAALHGADDAVLDDASAWLLHAVAAARPLLRFSVAPAVPSAARVLCAGELAGYARRSGGACGDIAHIWSSPAPLVPGAPGLRRLPVQPWAVVGTLRADSRGLHLQDGAGRTLRLLVLDALSAWALVNRPVLATRWALPWSPLGAPVLEVHSLQPLAAVDDVPCTAPVSECVTGIVLAVSPVLLVQVPFAVVVRVALPLAALGAGRQAKRV